MIYLDNAATTPISSSSLDAYRQSAERFYGNSSSLHDAGSEAERALESARRALSSDLQVSEKGLYFTGSGSEASFLSLVSLARANRDRGTHIITTEAEHSSVRNTVSWLEREGFTVTRLPLGSSGVLDMDEFASSLRKDTILVSIQYVNSEIGTIQPIKDIGKLLSGHQACFHSDLVQGYGKLTIHPDECNLDSFTISAHKIHGPKGIGCAWISPSIRWEPFIPETTHEQGFRPGTVDVPAAVAFAVAARDQIEQIDSNYRHAVTLREALKSRLEEIGEHVSLIGHPSDCSPYIAGIQTMDMEGQFAMLELSQKGVGVSTGSACQVNEQKPSATLLSMGMDTESARQFIRVSFSRKTTVDEINRASDLLAGILQKHHNKISPQARSAL